MSGLPSYIGLKISQGQKEFIGSIFSLIVASGILYIMIFAMNYLFHQGDSVNVSSISSSQSSSSSERNSSSDSGSDTTPLNVPIRSSVSTVSNSQTKIVPDFNSFSLEYPKEWILTDLPDASANYFDKSHYNRFTAFKLNKGNSELAVSFRGRLLSDIGRNWTQTFTDAQVRQVNNEWLRVDDNFCENGTTNCQAYSFYVHSRFENILIKDNQNKLFNNNLYNDYLARCAPTDQTSKSCDLKNPKIIGKWNYYVNPIYYSGSNKTLVNDDSTANLIIFYAGDNPLEADAIINNLKI